jgi:phosphatidate phosphatase APP1
MSTVNQNSKIRITNDPAFKRASVKVYHGYGHKHNLVVYGHVFKRKAIIWPKFTRNIFYNISRLFKLFVVQPFPNANVHLKWNEQLLYATSEKDGFFKFEWKSDADVEAGWHAIEVNLIDASTNIMAKGIGQVFIPHSTQYGFISDIDDTIMISHSATLARRMKELFVHNPRTRSIFPNVARHYELLSFAHTEPGVPNPFFYVSSSEWNLYDYLNEFFRFHGLPKGAFLLNQLKKWYQLLKTGRTKHEGKFIRVVRILEAFPHQQFILFGDNTQRDPLIYSTIAEEMPGKILAIYIRNIVPANKKDTLFALGKLKGVHTCVFNDSEEAIEHSRKIGLIDLLVQPE